MDLKSGYPYWLIKDGLPYDYPKLEEDIHTDVAIIGGGISGALASYHLVEAGISCVVVDSRTIGLGSTSASTSLLQYEIDTPLHKLKDLVGEKNAIRSYELCAESISKLGEIARKIGLEDFEFRESLYYAAKKSHVSFLQSECKARKNAGFDVELLDTLTIEKEFGFKAPCAILSASAAETNAYKMTHFIHQYCIKKGTKVFDRTEVEMVNDEKNSVILFTKNGFQIKAKKVVYATGYEVTEMLDKNIVKLHSTYATISEQFSTENEFWKNNALIWNTDDPYLYMRTTKDNRIIIGGRDDKHNNAFRRDKLIPKKTEQLRQDFQDIFSDIHFIPEYSWAGTFGSTKDGLPYMGTFHKYPNSYFSLGFGGNGITFSQIGAEIIRDLFLGKSNSDVKLFEFGR